MKIKNKEKQLNVKIPMLLYDELIIYCNCLYGRKYKIKNIVKLAIEDYIKK